ncbi:dihydropteroate synthase [soil metagenome]
MTVRIWGVVNVTPDSFSDGGRYSATGAAVAKGLSLIRAGAHVLDIGGESTRPGADPVSEAEEIARVVPVIEGLREAGATVPLSIDTAKPAVARSAVAAGAAVWNDVTALQGSGAAETAANLGCGVVLMHMQGEPRTMQAAPAYSDVVTEVETFLISRAEAAVTASVRREAIVLDPGIGFGKTLEHNLALLRALPRLASHGYPLLVGASRKRSIQLIDPTALSSDDRLGGSLAFALWAAAHGAAAVRVHDVRETAQALAVWSALG